MGIGSVPFFSVTWISLGCGENAEPTDLCSALSDLVWQMRRAGVPVLTSSEKFWLQGFLDVLELTSRQEVCRGMAVTKFSLAGPAAPVVPQLLQGLLLQGLRC